MSAFANNYALDAALHPDLFLQCPRCASELFGAECLLCSFQMRVKDGIVCALPPERQRRFAQFMRDYDFIRTAEGRFSNDERFYLDLPYRDITGHNTRQWKIRAISYNYLRRHILEPELKRGARILDVGAGNCWMSYRLAVDGYRPVAVDLLSNQRDGLAAARHYRKALPALFPRFQAEMERLPFRDGQFDAVVFNASFHYAEDYEAVLRSARRCLRRNGMLIVCDTPWYSRDASGVEMLRERRAAFLARYGTLSNSVASLEYLTDDRLRDLEHRLAIRWKIHSPNYGLLWAMRPLLAALRHRREPSRFRIYVAWKNV